MLPALLSMRNFLCYRDNSPPLDFTGVHVACLTGENGNGKSALLDAITWALWGEARTKSDDDLIHLGRTEMEVEFEFYVGEQRYRVIRKRKKGTGRSPGSTTLEFHLAGPSGWKPLTASHVRDTERAIRDVIKLDYETFIHSAYLIQGRADAFTLKTPGERKRILAEILGLSVYDGLEQRARYRMRYCEDQVRSLERDLQDLDTTLAAESRLRDERRSIEGALAQQEPELTRAAELVMGLRQAEQLLQLQQGQARQEEERCREAAREVQRAAQASERHQQEIARQEAVVREAEVIRSHYREFQDARAREQEYGRVLTLLSGLRARYGRLEQTIAAARAQLDTERKLLVAEVERQAALTAPLAELEHAAQRLQQARGQLAEDERHLLRLRQDEQEERETVGALRSELQRLRGEMDAIKHKQTELSQATVCPLCRTNLGQQGQAHIIAAYEEQGRQLVAQYREQQARGREREARAAALKAEADALEREAKRRQAAVDREEGTVMHRLQQASDAAGRLPELRDQLRALTERLARGDYAGDESKELAALAAEIKALDYDAAAHEQVREQIRARAPSERRYQDLQTAEARLEAERKALAAAVALQAQWQQRLDEHSAELQRLQMLTADLPDTSRRLAIAKVAHDELHAKQGRLRQALGAVEQQLDDCARKRDLRQTKAAALEQSRRDRYLYEQLTVAFSKQGIQALIIDHVLPEITEEANRLLGRMTNNRLQVMMDTQRETKKGSVTETLDIRISDELGMRSYELFSGGEAFRVNLALRIALSKLLARRAGAPLPTLVIDEGFGSQDAAARERLIEAINAIQSDFQCLLVITHIDELKDQFPVRIEVTKTAEGSVATVVG